MSLYKAVLKILKANKTNLLIAVIVTVIITFFYAQNTAAPDAKLDRGTMTIVTEDNSALSKALIDYLKEEQTVVELSDKSQKSIDDALYFGKIDYVLFLPKDFTTNIEAGVPSAIDAQSRPDAFAKTLIEGQVDTFLSTYTAFYHVTGNREEALKNTQSTLAANGEVTISRGYSERMNQQFGSLVFNALAYGLFLSIFSGYGVVNLVFNRKEIRNRDQVSPLSTRRLNRVVSIGMLGYSLLLTSCFTAGLLLFTRSTWSVMTGYLVINLLCFFLPIVTFSTCVTSFVKNSEALNGISNVYIMGSCFLGGVFVSSDFLPDFISKIASFTPTYWFVQNNQLIGNTLSVNADFITKFWLNCLILVLFACAFLIIQFVLKKDSRWFNQKRVA